MKKNVLLSGILLVLLFSLFDLTGLPAHAASLSSQKPLARNPLLFKQACSATTVNHAACLSLVSQATIPGPDGPFATAPGSSSPYKPANLHTAYNLPTIAPAGQVIGIVDAYDDPKAESDMAYYRSTFSIPACTTANGCFRKVDQNGGKNYPRNDTGWSQEISLDLDMASAICYNCKILLVEARSTSLTDLGTAVNTAVRLGATVVSNSYGANSEISGESTMCNNYYNHPGVAITASSGDSGLGVVFPAVCPHVVSVGGTTLYSDGNEVDWNSGSNGAGGGCSSQIAKPTWQSNTVTKCARRAVADVSAVADPNTGVYAYDTNGTSGWYQIGGTSASSPIIAAIYALAGGPHSIEAASIPWITYTTGCLNPVSSQTYTYQGGLGSPDGIACF